MNRNVYFSDGRFVIFNILFLTEFNCIHGAFIQASCTAETVFGKFSAGYNTFGSSKWAGFYTLPAFSTFFFINAYPENTYSFSKPGKQAERADNPAEWPVNNKRHKDRYDYSKRHPKGFEFKIKEVEWIHVMVKDKSLSASGYSEKNKNHQYKKPCTYCVCYYK